MTRNSTGPTRWVQAAIALLLVLLLLMPLVLGARAQDVQTAGEPTVVGQATPQVEPEPTALSTEPPADVIEVPTKTPVETPTEPAAEPTAAAEVTPVIEEPTETATDIAVIHPTSTTGPAVVESADDVAIGAAAVSTPTRTPKIGTSAPRSAEASRHTLVVEAKDYTVGSIVTVKGTGWSPGSSIRILFGSTVMATVRVDSRGAISASFRIPPVVAGTYVVAGQINWFNERVPISVVPAVKVDPKRVATRGKVTYTVTGFDANEAITFNVLDRIVVGNGRANASGSFSGTMTLPSSVKPGTYTVRAKGSTGTVVKTTLTVTGPAVSPTRTPASTAGATSVPNRTATATSTKTPTAA